jgi:hypothetical protein
MATSLHRVGISLNATGEPVIGDICRLRGKWRFWPRASSRLPDSSVASAEIAKCLPHWLDGVEHLTFITGPWTIWYAPPPIPTRSHDWHFSHANYDAEQFSDGSTSDNGLCGDGASVEDCLAQIAEIEAGE